MFQSFSFIISDLKVFGEVGTIPAPLLAGSVLWVYIFGAWLIPLSFQKEAKFLFTIVLLVHSQKVMWIERVLYSQNEESTYPAHFVAITSIVGAATAYRLHTNEVLDAGPACAVMGAYLSKVLVYFSDSVEIDYRWSDGSSASAIVRETLLAYGAWGALSLMIFAHMVLIPDAATAAADESGAAAAATTAARAAAAAAASATGGGGGAGAPALPPLPKEALRRIVCGLSIASFLVFFVAAAPTLVRWLVEDVGRVPAPSRVQLLGCSLVLAVAASLYIVRALLAGASSNHSARLLAGLAVFFVAATLLDPPIEALIDVYASSAANAGASGNNILDKSDVDLGRRLLPDLPFMAPWWSRWVLLLALALALAIRGVLGMGRLPPAPVRFALWAALGVLLGLSVTGCNIIIADWKVYLCMSVYFCLTLIGFDQAHYSSLDNTEVCISLFIGGLVSFVAGIFMLNHVDIFAVTRVEAFLLDGVFASRIGAIGILAVMNFAVTAAIKCRAHGFSLMPRPTQLANAEAYAQLSLVLSAACVLGAVAWILLSMLLGQGSAPLVLLASAQLMLVEDRGWGFGLEQGMRRYLLPFIVGSFCMWVRAAEEIRAARQSAISNMLPYYGAAALCAPSQVIVMLVLWRGGSADASVARSAGRTARGVWALLLLAVDLLVVVMTLSANLRMVAALNLIGHITRLSLFEGVIVRARETLL